MSGAPQSAPTGTWCPALGQPACLDGGSRKVRWSACRCRRCAPAEQANIMHGLFFRVCLGL